MFLDIKLYDGNHTGVSSQLPESVEKQMKARDNNEIRAEILMDELRNNLKNFGIGATKASGVSAAKRDMISPSNSGMLTAEGFIFLVCIKSRSHR